MPDGVLPCARGRRLATDLGRDSITSFRLGGTCNLGTPLSHTCGCC